MLRRLRNLFKPEMKLMLDKHGYIPSKAHDEDGGWDIYCPKLVSVPARGSAVIDTGVHLLIPRGYVGMIKSKSGLNVKHGLRAEGVVDAGYTGSIVVKIYNDSDDLYIFDRGDKLTQICIMPVSGMRMRRVERFKEMTKRGANGFGSTGK